MVGDKFDNYMNLIIINARETLEVKNMNFEEVYKEYLEYAKNQHKKQGFINLSRDFNCRVLPYFKDRNIEDITKQDYITWQNKILENNFKNSYNARLYYVFSKFLDYCCNFYALESNVAREIGNFKKKIEYKKSDFYTLKEFNQFIKCVDNEIYKQFFNLLFYTGVRPGEAMALQFSDLQGDYISITKNMQRKGNRELDTPKNTSSIRNIRIDRKLKKDLLKLKKYYEKKYNNNDYDYFVFGGIKPLSPTSIDRYKLKACQKANIRPITQHQFRHSHATLLLHNNIVINEVSRRLGHSKVSTTLDIYTHTNLVQEKRVTSTLNSLRFNFINFLQRL